MTNLIAESFKCRDTKLPPPHEPQMKTSGLENFIDILPAPVFIKDTKGTYIACNAHFAHFLGLEKDDILGKKASDLVPFYCAEEYAKKDMELFQNPHKAQRYEFVLPSFTGETRNVIFHKNALVDTDGEAWGIIGCIKDITEHRHRQNSLEEFNRELQQRVEKEIADKMQKDKLLVEQSKNALMGEMIGVIAHQWRQPLNAVAIIAQELKLDNDDGELTKEAVEYYSKKLVSLVEHMNSTIDDFRSFFKRGEPHKSSVIGILGESIRLLSEELKVNSISVKINGDDFELFTNTSELKQVFINLLVNAKDQINSVMPKSREIAICLDKEANSIEVADYAGGVCESIIKSVFEPYVSTKEEKGTGIGLYMVKMIVEDRMGGKISVTNKDGGACFRLDFKKM